MNTMNIKEIFKALGLKLLNLEANVKEELLQAAYYNNRWFEPFCSAKALNVWGLALSENNIDFWLSKYEIKNTSPKKIGVIMAGNIPMVGLHDALCVIASGHILHAKLSSDDTILMRFVLNLLVEIEPKLFEKIKIVTQLKDIDVLIATGSDNSARYFEYYFASKPKILRKNRTSVAILNGNESKEDIKNLGNDIFDYYGLGCRNVSKIFIPKSFEISFLYENIIDFSFVVDNNKYANNYDYNRAIYLLNGDIFLDNNFLILREDTSLFSPVGVLFYEYYDKIDDVLDFINENSSKIQCIVSQNKSGIENVGFGESQNPQLWNYADNIDVMEFLLNEA